MRQHPFMEMRDGKPFNQFEKLGPFTLHESNKGSYFLYSVSVTGGIEIYKGASKPSFYDVFNALMKEQKQLPAHVFDDYYQRSCEYAAKHPEVYPREQERNFSNCKIKTTVTGRIKSK